MSPFQSAHPLPVSEPLPPLPPHWPHDHCRQVIHWVLMVRHRRMQRWLSLCHLGAMVGKLLNSIPTAYVYHDKPVTYGFTLAIWGRTSHTHTWMYPPISPFLSLCSFNLLQCFCLWIRTFTKGKKEKPDTKCWFVTILFFFSFISRTNSFWNGKFDILVQPRQNNKKEILGSLSVKT